MPATWYTAANAKSDLGINVSTKQLALAQEECLRFRGLALSTEEPPTESFAQGVVYQALANKQSSQAAPNDETGNETNSVRLYPMDKKIQAMLIIADPDPDDATRDRGRVRSLIG